MKGLRIGRRRGREGEQARSPLELALRPALFEGRWQVPDRFNFTRDVVEALALDPKRRALTFIGSDGVIEPRTFLEVAEGAAFWALTLRERNVAPGDRVIVMAGSTVDWLEAVLGIWKVGAVVVPCAPSTTSAQLERLVSSTDAALVAAERSLEPVIDRMGFTPDVHLYEEGVRHSAKDLPEDVPTHDTASRDLAFVVSTSGATGPRKEVAHTHGSVFATRVQAEHWLDVGRGDTVWCTAEAASPLAMWSTVIGPWSRGAEVALHHGEFDVEERLDLLFKLGASILCQSPAEYRALAERPRLERFKSPRLRRLVSTGDYLDPEIVAVFEERWGMTIADGYGQAETNIVVASLADGAGKPGSLGCVLPGHHVAVIDDQGNELPTGIEGDLAVRGRPPTLFAGYWELPEETKAAFLGDWYLTGDVAHVDEDGFFTFVGRAADVITSSGCAFGPHEVERALEGHPAIAESAVVGIRDLQRGGHFVRAFVVPKHSTSGTEQHEAELRQYVAETLPAQQVPREIVFVDELPKVAWKVSRYELRERPLPVRPLWETPPADDPEPSTGSFDAEFSPRIDVGAEPPPVTPPASEAEPEPEPEPIQPEPPVAEALPEPEPALEADPVHEETPEPDEHVSEPPVPETTALTVVEPEELPDYVVETPAEPPPVVVPAPEPEPDLPGPLPDYVVQPGEKRASEPEAVVRSEPVPVAPHDEDEEEDLGPLPDFVIDPNDPEAIRRHAPPPPPEPKPILAPRAKSPAEEPPASPALNFPSSASFSIPRGSDAEEQRETRTIRPRPQAKLEPSKRPTTTAEPGDEAQEVDWMAGLSNRLSAYSLAEEEQAEARGDDGED